MSDITRLLEQWADGDADAFKALMPAVYQELRRLAEYYLRHERAGHTLQPTALVHEAYLRLAGMRELQLQNRAHFYGAAANVMRRVLVDYARQRNAAKRGGADRIMVEVDETLASSAGPNVDLIALDQALDALERIGPEKAQVVELRYFGGLSIEETAEYLNVAPGTVKRHWTFARAWLFERLNGSAPDEDAP